ncbi:amidohydrolase family protein [Nannocystis sp.]|uniref:amidohydrolase family protein n=1 Tax=Nannocystis sp. TaxID=1962667 RepID=UPI0024227D52|nr:amidohydrolase family protein [Nannocystis sp.]MBK7824564.1 amidohydrolase family protein [Nannocystis sp.]MBK9753184.1 amidohydrolase family protein [Nannocystis sp.]
MSTLSPRRGLCSCLVLAFVWALGAAPAAAAPAPTAVSTPARAGPVYLVGGELHVGDGTVIKDAVIAMDGGLFTIVGGPEARAKLLDESMAVDLKGKLITPGLFAAETQLGIVEIDLEGSTRDDSKASEHPVRAAYEAAAALNAESALIPIQAIDGVTSAAVVPTGGLISGQVAIIDLVYGDHRGLAAQPRAAISAHLGQAHAGSRAATLAKLREVLGDARGYPARRAAYDRAQSRELSAHPLDLEALQPIFKQQAVLTLSADRASDILAALDLARDFNLKITIVGGAEAWKVADLLARAKVPVILEPTLNIPGGFDSMGARLDNAALLHRAGVTVALLAPGGTHNLRSLPQGAGIAVAHGLPWEAALTAITLAPARAYGVERTHGSVAVGKVANLVVWSGDPFELSSAPTEVYVRGVKLRGTTRQNLLRDRYRDLKQFSRGNK